MTDTVKIKMNARELSNADVSFVSLVGRPANRIPFRVTKSDGATSTDKRNTHMFTLDSLSSLMKKSDKAPAEVSVPTVVAVCVVKGDNTPDYVAELTENGFSLEDKSETDGLSVYKQEDYDAEEVTAFQVGKDVSLLVAGVQKSFDPWKETSSFTENLGIGGFFPGLYASNEALTDTIRVIMRESEDITEASAKIKVAMDDHTSYVMGLATSLPEIAFKMDGIIAAKSSDEVATEVVKTEDEVVDTQKEEVASEVSADDVAKSETDEQAQSVEKTESDDSTDSEELVEESEDETEVETEVEEVAKAEEVPAWATALQKSVTDGLESVNDKLEGTNSTVEKMQEELAEVKSVAKSARDAVDSTVLSDSESDPAQRVNAKKSDEVDDEWSGTALDKIV